MIVRRIAGVVALTLAVAACGVSVSTETSLIESAPATVLVPLETTIPETTPPIVDDGFPVTVATGNGELVIQTRPEAIISLSPTATEMLFAIGAGDQVIAVDERDIAGITTSN